MIILGKEKQLKYPITMEGEFTKLFLNIFTVFKVIWEVYICIYMYINDEIICN